MECSFSTKRIGAMSFPNFSQNATTLFLIGSEECTSVPSWRRVVISDSQFVDALIYILIDLAPLMVYFPAQILFKVNLASGPGQSFLFFFARH